MLRSRDIRPEAVAIYIRWSTDEQTEGTTLEIQKERCSLFVRSQGWMVREDLIFVDEGYSGATLDRPAMKRLRQAVEAGLVSCVVTYKLDRLSRNLVDTVTLIRVEWAGKCVYRSATEGFDTSEDSPTGALIFNILASFAEFERAVIRDRTQAGTLRRMKEGMFITGTVPFGYQRAGKGQVAIKPEEAAVVRRMFDLAIRNVVASGASIARKLNEDGVPGPGKGGKWWASTVNFILRNPVYAGTLVYGKKRLPPNVVGGTGRYDVNGEATVVVEDAVPVIVGKGTFEKANEMLRQRTLAKPHHTNRASGEYLLTTIGKCKCGGPLGAVKDRKGTVYYRCQRKVQGVACPAGAVAFRGQPVEEKIVASLRARFGGTRRDEALLVLKERHASTSRRAELELAIKQAERRKAEVLADLARLRREAREGKLKASTYEEFKADAEMEMRDLEDRLRELAIQHAACGKDAAVVDRLEQALRAVDEWDGLSGAERKELLRALVQKLVVCYPGRDQGEIDLDLAWIG